MYATRGDLVARFSASEIDTLDADAGRVDARLADASAEIDTRLYAVYELPLAGGPWPQLRAIACDLARYFLYDDESPERVRMAAKAARRRLKMLADGSGLVDAAGVSAARRPLAQATAPEPALTRGALDDA